MKKIVSIFFFILLFSIDLFAQWQRNTVPFNTQCFAISENNIIVGTYASGLFVSSDTGSTWDAINEGIPCMENGWLYSIKCITVNGNNFYAGSEIGGIFLSKDRGKSWTIINSGLPDSCTINSIITIGATIFAGTDHGVFLSDDNGENWVTCNNGLTNLSVTTLSYNGNYIFAGTHGGGMFVTTINGENWTSINNGISNLNISSIAFGTNIIFIGTENGIFSSTDNGLKWNFINNGLVNFRIKDIITNEKDIYAVIGDSIYLSTDNGINWILKNDPIWRFQLEYNQDICAFGIFNDYVFTFRDDGMIFRSENNGTNWISLNLSESSCQNLACDGNLIYAGTECDGIFLSSDKGISWQSINNGLNLEYYGIRDIAIDGDNVFICTNEGIYLSKNQGEDWQKVSNYFANNITISGNNIYVGGDDIYLSTDTGRTWNSVTNNFPTGQIWSLESYGNNIYAGNANNKGLFLSTNSGSYWENIFPEYSVWSIEIDKDSIYFCTQGDGVYRSIDNGVSWEQINNGLPDLYTNTIEKKGGILVADGYISTDNGNNWNPLIDAGNVLDVEITEDFIFAATGGGVIRLPLPVLLVDDYRISFYEPDPDSATFNISSTTDWTITKSQDWYTCNTYSGSGNATIFINTTKNPLSIDRVDTITISGKKAETQKIVVWQYGQHLDTLTIEASANSSQSFKIYSSQDWSISGNQSWLSLSRNEGAGETTIILTATANPSVNSRIVTLKISGTGMDDEYITIIQKGGITNISEIYDDKYYIYPNPVSTILYINSDNSHTKFNIININGEKVMSNQIINNQINISNIKPGIYYLIIENKTLNILKFVKY